jgi:two-component system, OmpR family, response regulator CpxR
MIPTALRSKKTILCIDDDAAILCYEKALLERSGYSVLIAPSAQQGLKLATTCTCDAVLLEYEMSGMKGHEVAAEIKLVKPKVAVILLSRREVPPRASALVDAVVPKLEVSQQLLPIIAELCSRSQKGKHWQESV